MTELAKKSIAQRFVLKKPIEILQDTLPALGDANWIALVMKDVPLPLVKIVKASHQLRLKSSRPRTADYYLRDVHQSLKKADIILSRFFSSKGHTRASLEKKFHDKILSTGNFNVALDELIILSGNPDFLRPATFNSMKHTVKENNNQSKAAPITKTKPDSDISGDKNMVSPEKPVSGNKMGTLSSFRTKVKADFKTKSATTDSVPLNNNLDY